MPPSADQEIRLLRTSFWSARDPGGRAFAPLAEAFRQEGNLDEAEALLSEGLSRHPTFTTALLVAARVARDRGNLIAAREQLDRLLHLDGGNVLALCDRAEARLLEGDREGALHDLREASRLEPGNDEFRRRIASAGAAPTPAPAHVDEPDPEPDFVDRPILTRTMGDIYARQGFLARALEVYEHLHAENPDDGELEARLVELRGGGGTSRGGSLEPEVDADSGDHPGPAGHPDSGPERAARMPVPATRTIAGYFEDLLAWVPGAVPIASLAPDAKGPEQSKEEKDDFNRWLEGLGR